MRRLAGTAVVIAASIGLLAPLIGGATSASAAETVAPNAVDTVVQATEPFIVTDATGTSTFDVDAATQAGASPETLLAGEAFNDMVSIRSASQPSDGARVAAGFPVWGNWCGPGHGGGTAVDTLDRLCERHDKCYGDRGYFSCACDAQLKAEIDRFSGQMKSNERAVAAAIKLVFSTGVCNPF